MIWDKHASASGIGALCLCLLGGSLYQQAPLREIPGKGETDAEMIPIRHDESCDNSPEEDALARTERVDRA
jgi:hypothetical protein